MKELTIKEFRLAYAKRWARVKKSSTWPTRPLVLAWCAEWSKQNPPLARLDDEPLSASGKIWKIKPSALETPPPERKRRGR